MRFRTLLIHRCSLLTTINTGETDDYGRDIVSRVETMNVPCKFDNEPTYRAVSDETGTDLIYDNIMFFEKDQEINFDTEIHDIRDKEGNPVLPGSFSVLNITPVSDRKGLHHYEVTVRRM